MADHPGQNSPDPNDRPLPPAPEGVNDPEQLEAGAERWTECPLRDCKRNHDLLYQEFYLRDVRTNRLMCTACAVRTEVGYLAREVAKASDDRYFKGTWLDNIIVFVVVFISSAVVNGMLLLVNFWYIGLVLGGAAGAGIGSLGRTLTEGRVTRQSQYVAVAATVAGALPVLLIGYRRYGISIAVLVCTVAMASTIYGIFSRRI